ncbi:MAG: RsmD family RNA methyltransferase [Rhodospirillaceae bacterium]|nr:RsmD family RNA methyltransferase [Rhodospirillaceae bacterium]
MRITGGSLRGRRIEAPPGPAIRPTSDRARQALFNILAHAPFAAGMLPGTHIVDVFAGTGALGLEALSHGAAHATFIDSDPGAIACIRGNAAGLGESARCDIRRGDALKPGRAAAACRLAFLDPPYGEGLAPLALAALAEGLWLEPGGLCAVELSSAENLAPPAGFVIVDERTYRRAHLLFLGYRPK